jgi:tetratricopeptide (TPR) repeat protein
VAGDQNKFQVAMTHAERFSNEEKWADAMKAYRFALAEFPNNVAAIIGFGRAGLASGQVEVAQRAFQQVLKINPSNIEALNLLADVQERTGQLDAAAESYLKIGNYYASREDLDAAIDSWVRATKLASQVDAHRRLAAALAEHGRIRPAAREYLALAAIYQRRQELERSLEFIEAAQELLPDDPGITAALEALQTSSPIQPGKISDTPPDTDESEEDFFEDYDEGGDPFDDIADLFMDEPVERMVPSGGLVESGQQQAMEQLASAIFEDSDNPGTLFIMQALDLQSNDNIPEAIDYYRQAIQQGSKQPSLYFNLGLLYKGQGQINEAINTLKNLVQEKTYKLNANMALGELYYATGQTEPALRHFVEVVKAVDLQTAAGRGSYHLTQVYDQLAGKYLAQSDAKKIDLFITAVRNFFAHPEWERKAFEARQRMNAIAEEGEAMSLADLLETPETEVMIMTLAATSEYMKRNLLMTASEECLRAIQKAPSYLPLHTRLADILIKQERTDEAIIKYLYIAKVYQMRHQPDQTINVYEKVLKLAPMDVTVRSKLIDLYTSYNNMPQALDQYLILADSYYQLAQVDRALEKYSEALRMATSLNQSTQWAEEALTRMADIYNQRFDWAGAAAALEELLKLKPGNPQTLRQLVDLYYKQGKINQASAYLDKLSAVYQKQHPLKALELFRELSSAYPDDLLLRERLAVAYVQNNKTREAIAEYDALGEMQLERGLRDQAVQTIQAIINLGPPDVEGYRRLLAQISGSNR